MRCSTVLLLTVISSMGLAADLRGVSSRLQRVSGEVSGSNVGKAQTDRAIALPLRLAQSAPPSDPSTNPSPSPSELLGLGSEGDAVRDLQTTLNQLGYYYGAINGEFGKETQTALLTFQKESGLVATGELDDPTRARLQQARAELLGDETPLFGEVGMPSDSGLASDGAEAAAPEQAGASEEVAGGLQSESEEPAPDSTESAGWIGWAGLLAGVAIAAGIIYSQLRQGRLGALELDSVPALDGVSRSGASVLPEPPLSPGWSRAATANGDAPPNATPADPKSGAHSESASQLDPKPDAPLESAGLAAATSPSKALIPAPARSPQPANLLDHPAADADGEPAFTETTRLQRISIVDKLLEELQSPDPATRRKAIWELGQAGDSRAVQPLVDLLVEADSQQCSLILATLSEIALRTLKPMKQALLTSLRDSNADVRKNAIRDVTRMYDVVTQMSDLLSHAVSDPDPEVQATAKWAIAQLSRGRSRSDLNGSASVEED
jgi:hypothetical protein